MKLNRDHIRSLHKSRWRKIKDINIPLRHITVAQSSREIVHGIIPHIVAGDFGAIQVNDGTSIRHHTRPRFSDEIDIGQLDFFSKVNGEIPAHINLRTSKGMKIDRPVTQRSISDRPSVIVKSRLLPDTSLVTTIIKVTPTGSTCTEKNKLVLCAINLDGTRTNCSSRQTRITPINGIVNVPRFVCNRQPKAIRNTPAMLAKNRRIDVRIKSRRTKLTDTDRCAIWKPSTILTIESVFKINQSSRV